MIGEALAGGGDKHREDKDQAWQDACTIASRNRVCDWWAGGDADEFETETAWQARVDARLDKLEHMVELLGSKHGQRTGQSSTNTLSLSELKKARKRATFKTMTNDCGVMLDEDNIEVGRVESSRDGDVIVSTLNAADAMIALAEAALDRRAARDAVSKARDACRESAVFGEDGTAEVVALANAERRLEWCDDQYNAALDKVEL